MQCIEFNEIYSKKITPIKMSVIFYSFLSELLSNISSDNHSLDF